MAADRQIDTAPDVTPGTGDDVLDWLRGAEALSLARRWVHRRQLPGGDATVEDVLAEASIAMFAHTQRNPGATYVRPAAYGSTLIRNTTVQMLRDGPVGIPLGLDTDADPPEVLDEPLDPTFADGIRVTLEWIGSREPWLTSAALSYLTLLVHDVATPDGLPSPTAGSDERHARCWPALWAAGERAWFPADGVEPANVRRTRARRIAKVLARVELAFETSGAGCSTALGTMTGAR